MLGLEALLLMVLAASPADEGDATWAVLPVRGEDPPPRDPTLLRLTKAMGEAVHDASGEDVRVVSRELRDEACPDSDGKCPRHVNSLLRAKRVMSLVLADDRKHMKVRVFTAEKGLEREGELTCDWSDGMIACDKLGLQLLLAPSKDRPAAGADKKNGAAGDDEETPPAKGKAKKARGEKAEGKAESKEDAKAAAKAVEAAFKKLAKRLSQCKKQGYGELGEADRKSASVQLRIDDEGRATEVRLDPPNLHQAPAFACMARVLESLQIEPTGGTGAFRFPLP